MVLFSLFLEVPLNLKHADIFKTGTLTKGEPVVQEVLLISDTSRFLLGMNDDATTNKGIEPNTPIKISQEESANFLQKSIVIEDDESDADLTNSRLYKVAVANILSIAASAERGSEHPLSKGKRKMLSWK